MREIVFDTETTGFHHQGDDRITEVGCVEVVNYLPTGREWQCYFNPERAIPERVVEITGHKTEFYFDKPYFHEKAEDFIEFVGDARLVAHNADFDRGFINAELKRVGLPVIAEERFVDTLTMARNLFPGATNTLDALCKRMDISLDTRDVHGALIDARLLANVYLELNGGRERALDLRFADEGDGNEELVWTKRAPRPVPLPRVRTDAEREAHAKLLEELGETAIWQRFRKLLDQE